MRGRLLNFYAESLKINLIIFKVAPKALAFRKPLPKFNPANPVDLGPQGSQGQVRGPALAAQAGGTKLDSLFNDRRTSYKAIRHD